MIASAYGCRANTLNALARLPARAPAGIVFNEHTEQDGAVVFRHACKLGLEGTGPIGRPAGRSNRRRPGGAELGVARNRRPPRKHRD